MAASQSPHASFHWKDWLIVALIGAALYFINLGATRLWDVDEAIFSRASVEMMERGDWVTPYFNGQMFGHKPPVMYWCQMAAYWLFGTNEFAARFFSAVFGVATMLLTYELGRALFNRRVGLWSAVALGSCLNFAVIARAATPDVYLTFFCTLAVLVLVRGTARVDQQTDTGWQPTLPPRWACYALTYAIIGIATLVKGPIVGGIVPVAVWGMFLLVEQRRHRATTGERIWWKTVPSWFSPVYFAQTVWRMRPITMIAMILLVAGPWYAWVGIRTNGEFLREFFFVHNFGRGMQAMDSHSGPIFYYLIAVCVGTFPWCVLLGPALGNLVREIRSNENSRAAFTLLACWIGVWLGILSLAGTKLPSYVVPCYPALAIVFGVLVVRWVDATEPEHCRRWLRAAWGTTAAVGIGVLIAIPMVTQRYLSGEWMPALVGLVPVVGAIVGLRYSERGNPRGSLMTLAAVGIVFCLGLLAFAVLPIDRHQNSQMFADYARQHSTGAPQIASHNYLPPSLVFYHRDSIDRTGTPAEIVQFFASHSQDAFLITTGKHYDSISKSLPTDVEVLKRDRRFLRPGEVVLLGRQPAVDTATRATQSVY